MIGHQVLLNSNDSISRVLPIQKEGDRFSIEFESPLQFEPDQLVTTIDKVVKETDLAKRYIIEVIQCDSDEVIYSFEMNEIAQSDIVPCRSRQQEMACYKLLFTMVEPTEASLALMKSQGSSDRKSSLSKPDTAILALGLILSVIVVYLLMRKRKQAQVDPNLISLGEYQFDQRNTELLIEEQRIELTSKEADLLLLLRNAANKTVERDVILNEVWGDQGKYEGRTLDVFISKLRKKLEFDTKVKIVNIRGVGYKLVMDV